MTDSPLANSYKTKNELVYDYLRMNILKKHFKPGDKLTIREISRSLNVSDIPVREAIKKLETQGLLHVIPHVGAHVASIDRREMEEIYIIRSTLEALATQLACPYLKKDDFQRLEKILEKYEEAVARGRHEPLGGLNKQFHLEIYKCSPYTSLYKMISDIWERSLMIRHAYLLPPSLREQSMKEHRLILEDLKKGNGNRAAEIVRKQKIASWNAISKFMEEETRFEEARGGNHSKTVRSERNHRVSGK